MHAEKKQESLRGSLRQTDTQLLGKAAIEDCHFKGLRRQETGIMHDEVTENSFEKETFPLYCTVGFQF